MQIISHSAEQTEQIAKRIGKSLRGGEVIELLSDLGGGKTTFTRGLAEGLNITSVVSSPTFTISKEYSGGRLHLYHFDFYRLGESGLMGDELAEILGDNGSVVVVEWAGIVQSVLPETRLRITITATSEHDRTLEFTCPETLNYTLEGLK